MVKDMEGQRGKIRVADPLAWNKGEDGIHYNINVFYGRYFLPSNTQIIGAFKRRHVCVVLFSFVVNISTRFFIIWQIINQSFFFQITNPISNPRVLFAPRHY